MKIEYKHIRHELYSRILTQLKVRKSSGKFAFLCHIIELDFAHKDLNVSDLPELWAKRPLEKKEVPVTQFAVHCPGMPWFETRDYESRIKILEQCIQETAPTKEDRHELYKQLRRDLTIGSGYCVTIQDHFGICVYAANNFKAFFPELYNKKPEDYFMYWFPCDNLGYEKRIELLDQCIAETA